MLPHITAAALASESKVLAHPASVDSIPTSANKEDHVSMGAVAARKAARVVENTRRILAIELMAACQALEFLKPLETSTPLRAVYRLVRERIAPHDRDRVLAPEIEWLAERVADGAVVEAASAASGTLD
jgi:histidine ammonia-lyase